MLLVGCDLVAPAEVKQEGQRIDVHCSPDEDRQQCDKDEAGVPIMLSESKCRYPDVCEDDVFSQEIQQLEQLKVG